MPGVGCRLGLQSPEQMHRSSNSKELLNIPYHVQILVRYFPVKNFPLFSIANAIRSKRFSLEWNLPTFCYHLPILSAPTDSRMPCLLASLLHYPSFVSCPHSSELILWIILLHPSLRTWLWKSSLLAKPRSSLFHLKQCFSSFL